MHIFPPFAVTLSHLSLRLCIAAQQQALERLLWSVRVCVSELLLARHLFFHLPAVPVRLFFLSHEHQDVVAAEQMCCCSALRGQRRLKYGTVKLQGKSAFNLGTKIYLYTDDAAVCVCVCKTGDIGGSELCVCIKTLSGTFGKCNPFVFWGGGSAINFALLLLLAMCNKTDGCNLNRFCIRLQFSH